MVVVVEPARERLHREGHAVCCPGAKVALAQVELRLGKRGLELVARNAVLGKLAAGVFDELAEAVCHVRTGALELKDHLGLGDAVDERGLEVVGKAGVEDAALERGLVGAAERVEQHVHGEHALALVGRGDDIRQAHRGVIGGSCHLDLHRGGGDRRLERKGVGLACIAVLGTAEALVDEGQLAVYVHVPVEDGVAVGQGVMAGVCVKEALVGEGGDGTRRAAGLKAVGALGEERARERQAQDLVWV